MTGRIVRKYIALMTLLAFIVSGNAGGVSAQSLASAVTMPQPGALVDMSAPIQPPVLKGLKVYADEPFRLDFILDKGDATGYALHATSSNSALKLVSARLIKYFLASLTIPEKDLWVNLSPYEKDRIVPEAFGRTEMGRDLLAQDYLLKQLTASALYPEGETGKEFWKKVYAQAYAKYGTTDIPVDTFNKVWITPDRAVVYENGISGSAYIVESRLKVMLEQDYFASTAVGADPLKGPGFMSARERADTRSAPTHNLAKQVLKEIVIPVLEKEVNEGANFAPLRQVYQSLILAAWYKKKVMASLLSETYVDKNKVQGLQDNPLTPDAIWTRYVESFKKGAFNLVREEADPFTDEHIPRKYFSGGMDFAQGLAQNMLLTSDPAQLARVRARTGDQMVQVSLLESLPGDLEFPGVVPAGSLTEAPVDEDRVFARLVFLELAEEGPEGGIRLLAEADDVYEALRRAFKKDAQAILGLLLEARRQNQEDTNVNTPGLARWVGRNFGAAFDRSLERIKNIISDPVELHQELEAVISTSGQALFDRRKAEAVAKRFQGKGVNARASLEFYKELLGWIYVDSGQPLFTDTQAINLASKIGSERFDDVREGLQWLLTLRDDKGSSYFNGAQMVNILIAGKAMAPEDRDFIGAYLRKLRAGGADTGGTLLFTPAQAAQILAFDGSAAYKRRVIEYLNARDIPGALILLVLSGQSQARDQGLLKPLFQDADFLGILKSDPTVTGEGESAAVDIFDQEHLELFMARLSLIPDQSGLSVPLSPQDLADELLRLERPGDRGPEKLFNDKTAQAMSRSRSLIPKLNFFLDLLRLKDGDGRALFSVTLALQMAQRDVSGREGAILSEIALFLAEPLFAPRGGTEHFNGSNIRNMVLRRGQARHKLELVRELKALLADDGTPFFTPSQISMIVGSSYPPLPLSEKDFISAGLGGDHARILRHLKDTGDVSSQGVVSEHFSGMGESARGIFGAQYHEIGEFLLRQQFSGIKAQVLELYALRKSGGRRLLNGEQVKELVYREAYRTPEQRRKFIDKVRGDTDVLPRERETWELDIAGDDFPDYWEGLASSDTEMFAQEVQRLSLAGARVFTPEQARELSRRRSSYQILAFLRYLLSVRSFDREPVFTVRQALSAVLSSGKPGIAERDQQRVRTLIDWMSGQDIFDARDIRQAAARPRDLDEERFARLWEELQRIDARRGQKTELSAHQLLQLMLDPERLQAVFLSGVGQSWLERPEKIRTWRYQFLARTGIDAEHARAMVGILLPDQLQAFDAYLARSLSDDISKFSLLPQEASGDARTDRFIRQLMGSFSTRIRADVTGRVLGWLGERYEGMAYKDRFERHSRGDVAGAVGADAFLGRVLQYNWARDGAGFTNLVDNLKQIYHFRRARAHMDGLRPELRKIFKLAARIRKELGDSVDGAPLVIGGFPQAVIDKLSEQGYSREEILAALVRMQSVDEVLPGDKRGNSFGMLLVDQRNTQTSTTNVTVNILGQRMGFPAATLQEVIVALIRDASGAAVPTILKNVVGGAQGYRITLRDSEGERQISAGQLGELITEQVSSDTTLVIEKPAQPLDVDSAMTGKGGIDLNPAGLDLKTRSGSEGRIRFRVDPQRIQRFKSAEGLEPFIINIEPLASLPVFLGMGKE